MLQIVLAVIGMSVVGLVGFVTLEQFSMQQRMQDQRENIRRLDLAAEGLQQALGRLPGVDTLVAPAAASSADVSWSVLPASIGALNRTTRGVPFLYCPVSSLSGSELASLQSSSDDVVSLPNGDYSVKESGGFVVSSSLAIDNDVRNIMKPLAFIVSAGTVGDSPPSCSTITLSSNGKAVVSGGIVRVVSMPVQTGAAGVGMGTSAEFWVSPTGSGNGRSVSSPSSINAALEHFSKFAPDNMTVHFQGTVKVSPDVWNRFRNASRSSGSKLRLIGEGSAVLDAGLGIAQDWDIPSETFLENVTISGPLVTVGVGDKLFIGNSVAFQVEGGRYVTLFVNAGGSIAARGASIYMGNPGQYGIINYGSVDLRNSLLRSGVGTMKSMIWNIDGGSLNVSSSTIGSSDLRTTEGTILSEKARFISSDGSSSAYASQSNSCWWSGTEDYAFRTDLGYVLNGAGNGTSAILPETNFPQPAADASAAEIQAYQDGLSIRTRGRRANSSAISCL